ncbi:glycosyltransferase family A protein [Poseidonocella sedimentorum]|uniref:Glycosyl transferase family 2 n=1 Tax=Poseidonocella sedimentorum TaxID=871652 RepID=A0A1I6D3B3_9RHOB|nr:glycosyltransferase family A protein [Poseidonocella sedimentorum]SFQ99984.1 hypothetical protein SAMN04515673_10265 [Poseidonocella sedimentorum]
MQRKTVSQWQRVLRPALARLAPDLLSDLDSAEAAALALRAAPRLEAPARVTFVIPLVGRAVIADWEQVVARLRDTVESLLHQSDPRWQAIICCEDTPDLPWSDQLRHLPYIKHDDGFDKWDKLRHLVDAACARGGPGYLMPFDADDLAHPDLVRDMLRGASPTGYLMTSGYLYDVSGRRLARAEPRSLRRPRQKAFWKLCGSCAAFPLLPGDPLHAAFLQGAVSYEHRMFEYLARLSGRPLAPEAEPRVTYMTNHGNNFSKLRGRGDFKSRLISRYEITDTAALDRFAAAFPMAADPGS